MPRSASYIASAIAGIFALNAAFAGASGDGAVNTGTLLLPEDAISIPCWPDNVKGLRVHGRDAAGQESLSGLVEMTLPKRVFKNPLARALETQRCALAEDPSRKEAIAQELSSLLQESPDPAISAPAWAALHTLQRTLAEAKTEEDLYKFIALSWEVMLLLETPPHPPAERPLRNAWNDRAADAATQMENAELLKQMEAFLAQQEQNLADSRSGGKMSAQKQEAIKQMLAQQRAMLDELKRMNADLAKSNPDLARKALKSTLDQMRAQMQQQQSRPPDGQHEKKDNPAQSDGGESDQKESGQSSGADAQQGQNKIQGQMQAMRDAQKMQKQYEELQKIIAEQQKILDETGGQHAEKSREKQAEKSLDDVKNDISRERQKQKEKQETAERLRAEAEKQKAENGPQDSPGAIPGAEERARKLEMEAQKLEEESRKNIEKLDKMDAAIEDMQKQDRMNEQQKKEMLEKLEEMVQSLQQMNKSESQKQPDKKEDDSQKQDEEEQNNPLTTQELEKLLDKIKGVVKDLATFFTEQQKTVKGMSEENIKNLGKTAEWAAAAQKREELRTIVDTLRSLIDMDPMSGTVELRDRLDQLEELLDNKDVKKESAFRIKGKPILLASADPAVDRLILAQAMAESQKNPADMDEIKKELGGIANTLRQKNQDRIKRTEAGQELIDHMHHYIKDLDARLGEARKDGREPERPTLESMTKEARKIIETLQKLSQQQQQMEDQTGNKKDQEGSSAPPPDLQIRQEAEEQIDQLMRQLEQMQKPQEDGPAMQMKMDKKNQVPTKLDEQQENLRNRLNQLQEQMDQGMLPLDEAGEAMDESSQQLRQNNRKESAARQQQAIQSLEQAAGELKARMQQSLQGASMPGSKSGKGSGGPKDREQGDIEQGLTDPLGRDPSSTPAGNGNLPEDGPAGRARDIEKAARERLSDPATSEKERRYLERVIKRYGP